MIENRNLKKCSQLLWNSNTLSHKLSLVYVLLYFYLLESEPIHYEREKYEKFDLLNSGNN
jgi:hypothetical protein